jgi:hypothetical protein
MGHLAIGYWLLIIRVSDARLALPNPSSFFVFLSRMWELME